MSIVPKTKVECPIAIKWLIPENRLRELKDKSGEYLYTDFFKASNISDVEYYLLFYPNNKTERSGQAGIYLVLRYSHGIKIEANFNIKIESANYTKNFKYVYQKFAKYGEESITTEELFDPEKRFIADGKMMIKMEGILTIEKEMPVKNETFDDDSDSLCLGLWNHDDKDFTLIAEGKQIMAHKNVLATRSRVFDRMFESGMKEAQKNEVEIQDFTFDIVEMAVKLCYHRSLVSNTTLEDKFKILQFCDKYDIQKLKNNLVLFLMSEINESTVCSIANASLLSNAVKLEEKCAEFLRDCMKTKPIKDFDSLDKDFALNLLKDSFCHVSK